MSDNNTCSCNCDEKLNLVFSCSGAADVGGVCDGAARKMTEEKMGKMYCLAGIGGNVKGIVETTKSADKIIAIDGCSVSCTKKLLERNNINDFVYLELGQMGMKKGETPAIDENIKKVVLKAGELLGF